MLVGLLLSLCRCRLSGSNCFRAADPLWNSSASGSLNAACLASFGPADAWKCFLQQYAAVFIATPYIILNSAYDMWQITTDLSLGCVPSVVGDSSSLHAELPPIFQRFASGLAPSACVCVCGALMVIVVVLAASRDSCSAMNHAQASHISTPCSQQETT